MEYAKPSSVSVAHAHPSLALVKYWGKKKRGINVPATTSVAVTLSKLCSTVRVSLSEESLFKDELHFTVDGVQQTDERVRVLCKAIDALHLQPYTHIGGTRIRCTRIGRTRIRSTCIGRTKSVVQMLELRKIRVRAENNFATAAGLASSASGGAALTLALLASLGIHTSTKDASALARTYSGSACRSIFGGFVQWKCGAHHAIPIVDENHWSDFRVIVLTVTKAYKSIPSRDAMTVTRDTSAYYHAWVRHNNALAREAVDAIVHKNIEKLGEISVRSYTAMHASAFAAYPPILYWQPATVAVLHAVYAMRKKNIAVWETMDAGPQVKLITLQMHVDVVQNTLKSLLLDESVASVDIQVCGVGTAATRVE